MSMGSSPALLLLLPVNDVPGKAAERGPSSCVPATCAGGPDGVSSSLALAWASSSHCGHLGSKQVDGMSLSLPITVTSPNIIISKNGIKLI